MLVLMLLVRLLLLLVHLLQLQLQQPPLPWRPVPCAAWAGQHLGHLHHLLLLPPVLASRACC
jgi:hypothetical protein